MSAGLEGEVILRAFARGVWIPEKDLAPKEGYWASESPV